MPLEALAWSQRNGSQMSAINAEAIYAAGTTMASGFQARVWMLKSPMLEPATRLKALIVSARRCPQYSNY